MQAIDMDSRCLGRGYALRRIFSPKREELREGWIIVFFLRLNVLPKQKWHLNLCGFLVQNN
jgi:hypothetical protein